MKTQIKTKSKRSNFILLKYFSDLLIKNKMIWIMMIINVALISVLQIIPAFNKQQDYYYAYKTNAIMYWGAPNLVLIIFITLCVINLFVITKRNNIDLYLYTKSFDNKKIVWYKQLTVIVFSSHIILGIFIGMIIQISLKLPSNVIIFGFIGQVVSIITLMFIWTFSFSFIAIFFKFFSAIFTISSISIGLILGATIPIIAQQNYQIKSNFNIVENKNNIIKIYQMDDGSKTFETKPIYALYHNPLAKINNNLQGWKPNNWVQISPFNVIFGFNNLIGSNVFRRDEHINNLINANTQYSFNDIKTNTDDLQWGGGSSTEYIVAGLNEKTIFDYPNQESLYKEIDQELLTNNYIAAQVKNGAYWTTMQNELKSRSDWNNSLSDGETIMLLHMMGLDSSTSVLYTIFNDYDIFKTKLNFLSDYLTKKYSQEFSDFLNYIWTSHQVKINVYAYKSLGNFNDFSQYRPHLKTYDPLERADDYDIAFVKNKLFNVIMTSGVISSIQMLNQNGIYEDINDFKAIFPAGTNGMSVTNKQTFDDYIENHATINNLEVLIRNASSKINGSAYEVQFRNNVNNNLIVDKALNIQEPATMKFTWIYLIGLVAIGLAMQYATNWKVTKGDLI